MTDDDKREGNRAVEEFLRELLPQAAKLAFRLRDFAGEQQIDPEPIFGLMMEIMGHAVDAPPEVRELTVMNQAQADAMLSEAARRKAHLN